MRTRRPGWRSRLARATARPRIPAPTIARSADVPFPRGEVTVPTEARRSPDTSTRGTERPHRVAVGPRVVRALGQVERRAGDGSVLDGLEHFQDQLCGDLLRPAQETVERLVRLD